MDPYIDTIPHDHGPEIKKRVAERDGEDEEGRPLKRARAQTLTLLTPETEEDCEELPMPEEDLSSYNQERLKNGLKYINHATKRIITPRTNEFLKLYKDAYKAALESDTVNEASQAVVKALDQVYCSASFYFRPREPEENDQLNAYLKLRRIEMLANYGDYLGQELQEIRADLKEKAKVPGDLHRWTEIADELKGLDANDLRKQVWTASGVLGIDTQHMIWLIKEWAEKKRILHCQIREHISECHWARLADQLCLDLKELINVAPNEETAAKYEKVLLSIINEYFTVYEREDPQHWVPNDKAKRLLEVLMDQKKKQALKVLNMSEGGEGEGEGPAEEGNY